MDNKPQQFAHPDLVNLIRMSLNTVGIAGVFAAIGYITLIAHQEFLGIQLEINSVTELSFSAAAFCFETFRSFIEQVQIHWRIAALLTLLILSPLFVRERVEQFNNYRLRAFYHLFIVLAIFAASSCSLLLYELPSMKLRNILIVGICSQPYVGSATAIDARTKQIWTWMLDARGGINCPTQDDSKTVHMAPEEAKRKLKDAYTLTFLSVVLGWFLVYHLTSQPLGQWIEFFRIMAIIELTVSTLFVPYVHGKLISPTTMPRVAVMLQDKSEASTGASKTRREINVLSTGERYLEGGNLLIAENDKSLVVFNWNSKAKTSRLIDIPRSKIERIEIYDPMDALTTRIELGKDIDPLTKN